MHVRHRLAHENYQILRQHGREQLEVLESPVKLSGRGAQGQEEVGVRHGRLEIGEYEGYPAADERQRLRDVLVHVC